MRLGWDPFEEIVEEAGGAVADLKVGGIDAGKGRAADIAGDSVIVHSDDSEGFGDGDAEAGAGVEEEGCDVVAGNKDAEGKSEGFEPLLDTFGIALLVFLMGFVDGERGGFDAEFFGFLAEALAALDRPTSVGDAAEGEASEALLDEVAEGNLGDGVVIGVDERKRAIKVIAEDVDDDDALRDEFVRARAAGFIVDAGDDAIDAVVG